MGSTNLKKGLRLSKIRGEPVKTKTVIEGINVYVRCGMVALKSVFFLPSMNTSAIYFLSLKLYRRRSDKKLVPLHFKPLSKWHMPLV